MNKEQFYREDYKTFKPKYFLFCREKEFKKENFIEKFAQVKNNNYICRIKITEL